MAMCGKPIAEPQSVTCRMGSHRVTDKGECAPLQPKSERPVLDLPTLEGLKPELALVLVIYLNGLPDRE